MKKMMYLLLGLWILLAMPALAMAETEHAVVAAIDWTPLIVAVIGVIGTALSALFARVWVRWGRPWLEKRNMTDAAKIVVEAVEAILGRYCGAEKWKLALEKMEARGFNIDSDVVLDALRAAWRQLDMAMIASGEKKEIEGTDPPVVGGKLAAKNKNVGS